ncbi:MAG: arylsulfatase [Planctomycetaceae bacterium]|jgi:arylsulfatase A|nr:arylsulfatase [Planctomycetaceae bacterium]
MFNYRLILTWTSIVLFCGAPLKTNAVERPNIVFILADDLGYGDIKAFGGDKNNIDTPHFDRLCSEGMKFTNAHVTDSVCVPSRTSIMTGRYAFRFGKAQPGGPWGFTGLRFPTTQHTLGHMFQAGGYATGYVGKWHLGTRMTTRDGRVQGPLNTDFTQPIEIGVSDYGFSDCFFLPGSLDMFPYAFIRGKQWQGKITAQKGWSAFNRVGPAAEGFLDTDVLPIFCDEAGKFIKASAKKDKPFFLFVALTAPHTPTSPEVQFQGKSRIGIYGDFVMNTDACIGRIRDHLAVAGVDKKTIIMVSSDHGPGHYSGKTHKATANQMREMEKDGHYSTGPWRGYKFSAYEGGLRVPFAAVWPGVVKPGSVTGSLIGLNDLMATWSDIANIKLSSKHAPDSVSFLSVLNNSTISTRNTLVTRGTRTDAFIDGDWKLILGPGSGSSGPFYSVPKSEDAWKLALEEFGRHPLNHNELANPIFVQLFNLRTDPAETMDLSAENTGRLKTMLADYQQIIRNGRSTSGPRLPNDRDVKAFRPPAFVWNK